MQTFTKVGLDALLTPENCAVLLIDHQPSQLEARALIREPKRICTSLGPRPPGSSDPIWAKPIRRIRWPRLSVRILADSLQSAFTLETTMCWTTRAAT